MFKFLIRTIVRAYDKPAIKTYVYLRFKIINPHIIDAMLTYFEPRNRTLVLGCGFGLFDLLMGLKWPEKKIHGLDIDAGRIQTARRAAEKLNLRNNTFDTADLAQSDAPIPQTDEVLLLDILHHIPYEAQERIIARCYEAIAPNGVMVVKDIHREAPFKLFFTWLLDMIMTRGEAVYYRDKKELVQCFENAGFHVIALYLDDILPYPHILYVCHKPAETQPREPANLQ